MDAGRHGVDAERVAQLRITTPRGPRRGSGYRVGDKAVLTAAHLVENASDVVVVFRPDHPDGWSAPATVRLCATKADVAVLTIEPPPGQTPPPVRFGRVGGREATVDCRAVGFPIFKRRSDSSETDLTASDIPRRYRDSYQVDGKIASLSNAREGTLEITVMVPPGPNSESSQSPWEGMSGAAVWCAGHIVGVVSRHHLNDGPNRLAAVRVERWYDELAPHELAYLRAILALPDEADQLPDVIPNDLSAGSWRGGLRREVGVLDAQYEAEVKRWFVPPDGFEEARSTLETRRMVMLHGAAGRGRRTVAVRLLAEHRPADNPIVQLPTQWERPGQPPLDVRDIAADDRLLLDLSTVDDDRFAAIQEELLALFPWIHEQRAVLVVVLPPGATARAALGRSVRIGRPDAWSVLRAHLGARGVEIVDAQLAQGLDDVLGRGRMADLADLAALVVQAKDRAPSADLRIWLKEAVAARDDRANDVASQVALQREGGFRAFLLSAAMLEGHPAEVVFEAQRLLLRSVGMKTGNELEQPDRVDYCRQAGVETGEDTRLWFTQLSHGRAVRRHFWDNFPGLRDRFCDWLINCGLQLALSGKAGQQVVHGFVHECLRLSRAGDVINAVERWTRGELLRTTLAARALELGLTDVREGVTFRQQCYSWAIDHQLAAPLARVVIAACVDVIVLNHPNQALVRLHHLTFHRDVEVARAARVEILRLAGDRRILRRLLARLTDQKFRRLARPSDRRMFLAAVGPDRLVEEPSLVGEKVVRQQLVEGWKAVFDLDEKRDYENVVRRWLDAHSTPGHSGLLDVLIEACGYRFGPRATLFAISRRWCEESGDGPDGPSRLATFAYVESAIDTARGYRPNQEGRAS